MLCVYPDRDTARDNSKDRILPMLTSSPRLRKYLTGYDDDEASMRIKLKHMPLNPRMGRFRYAPGQQTHQAPCSGRSR